MCLRNDRKKVVHTILSGNHNFWLVKPTNTYPSLKFVLEYFPPLFKSSVRIPDLFFFGRLVNLLHGCNQSRAASSLALVAIEMTEALVGADEVGLVRQLNHNLK